MANTNPKTISKSALKRTQERETLLGNFEETRLNAKTRSLKITEVESFRIGYEEARTGRKENHRNGDQSYHEGYIFYKQFEKAKGNGHQ